jgi:hypothetical protein
MDVRQLAPALLALSDGIQETSRIVSPAAPIPSLHITATREGSFMVDLTVVEPVKATIDFLAGNLPTAIVNLTTIVGIFWNAFGLVKRIGRRKVVAELPAEEPGTTTLELSDHTAITVETSIVVAYRSVRVRNSIRAVLDPLSADGVETFSAEGPSFDVRVQRDDVPVFDVPALPDELLSTDERTVTLQLLGVEFDNRKWRFTEGGESFFAEMLDANFRDRVERQEETFGSADLLKVMLRTRQSRTASGLKLDRCVIEVIEHIDGGRQLPFDFAPPG